MASNPLEPKFSLSLGGLTVEEVNDDVVHSIKHILSALLMAVIQQSQFKRQFQIQRTGQML